MYLFPDTAWAVGAVCRTRPNALAAVPPADCLSYSASHVLARRCYGRQRCRILVDDHDFGSPCLPGARKYLTVAYACGKIAPSAWVACPEEVAMQLPPTSPAALLLTLSSPQEGPGSLLGLYCCR